VATGEIADIAADDDGVFWLDGGAVLGAQGSNEPAQLGVFSGRGLRIATDDTSVYWAHSADHHKHEPSLHAVRKIGGPTLALLDGQAAGGAVAQSLTLSATHVIVAAGDGSLRAIPKDGTTPDRMLWSTPGPGRFWPRGLATAGEAAFFTPLPVAGDDGFQGELSGVLLSRGTLLGSSDPAQFDIPGAIAGDGRHLYFAHRGGGGRVRRVDADLHPDSFVTLIEGVDARSLAVNGGYLYWNDGQSVGRVPKAGGPVEKLACGGDLDRVAVGSGHVYWVEGGRRLLQAPLPPAVAQDDAPTAPAALEGYQGPTHPETLTVRALIDGVTQLFVQKNKIWWRVIRVARPGWVGTKIKPSQINGQPWDPDYPAASKAQFGFSLSGCNCESDPLELPSTLAATPQQVTLEAKGRGTTFVAQQPSSENDGLLIVSIDDPIDGADWYDLSIRYLAEGASP
jgi:hypothetical protein